MLDYLFQYLTENYNVVLKKQTLPLKLVTESPTKDAFVSRFDVKHY